ncbi:20057_t:CDS:2, partial [Dentiscutata erythropus]
RDDQSRFIKENTILTPAETQYLLNKITKTREAVDAKNKFSEILMCPVCNLTKYSKIYCEHCMRSKLKIDNWSSGNNKLDIFLRKCQDESPIPDCIVEWIEFRNLMNVKFLAEGGFGKVYSSMWTPGKITGWNEMKNTFVRKSKKVALKVFNGDGLPGDELFREAHWNQIFTRKRNFRPCVVNILGFTKNQEGKYMIVLDLYGNPYLANDIICGLRPSIIPGTPKKYADLMCKSWAKDPHDRISAKDAVQILRVLLRDMMENNFIDEYSTEKNSSWNPPKFDFSVFRTSERLIISNLANSRDNPHSNSNKLILYPKIHDT